MNVCFFGGYDQDYPRNAVIRRGLRANGVGVSECRVSPGGRFWLRYPLLLSRWLSQAGAGRLPSSWLFVPEFCQKDVPLARFLALVTSRRLVFDPLASRYETKILDWRRKPEGSLAAWWNRMIDLWALRLSGLVLADTQAHRRDYCRRFGLEPCKVRVLPVGFDDRVFSRGLVQKHPGSEGEGASFTVVFFGSFLPLHGIDVIARAAGRVWQEDRTVRFRLIGSGQTYPRVRQLAADLGLDNITFEEWTSQPCLAEKIARQADLCLGIFGATEKAGRVVPHKIFQSMALRKPVVTSRTPAVQEFFAHGKNIFLCKRGDPESLARAILELKRDKGLREEIARAGYELVWEKYHPRALGGLLKTMLEDHSRGRRPGKS
jgi:glycosyltransferase involved in cell wall biosynthesis